MRVGWQMFILVHSGRAYVYPDCILIELLNGNRPLKGAMCSTEGKLGVAANSISTPISKYDSRRAVVGMRQPDSTRAAFSRPFGASIKMTGGKVFVGSLSPAVTEEALLDTFNYIGPVEDVKIVWEHDAEQTPFAFLKVGQNEIVMLRLYSVNYLIHP